MAGPRVGELRDTDLFGLETPFASEVDSGERADFLYSAQEFEQSPFASEEVNVPNDLRPQYGSGEESGDFLRTPQSNPYPFSQATDQEDLAWLDTDPLQHSEDGQRGQVLLSQTDDFETASADTALSESASATSLMQSDYVDRESALQNSPEQSWSEARPSELDVSDVAKHDGEYPNARIIPESEGSEVDVSDEDWVDQQEESKSNDSARVRILWPALGFPSVIAPRSPAARAKAGSDASRYVSVLLLASRALTPADVAHQLRCVTWNNRWQRHVPEGASFGTFKPTDIAVRVDSKATPITLPTPDNRLTALVGFGGGVGEKSSIVGGLSREVLDFYMKKLPKSEQLPFLHEIRISEDASNLLPDGQYQLFWNNDKPTQDAPSDEMRLLIDYHAQSLRERTVESYEKNRKFLLEEYEFEYGYLHQPYQQAYSQLGMRRPRAEVLHPLFVKRSGTDLLRIGHLTDLHVDVRADVYEANLNATMNYVPKPEYLARFRSAWETLRQTLVAGKRAPSPWKTRSDLKELVRLSGLTEEIVLAISARLLAKHWRKGSYNNLNRSFHENYVKAKAESDILLLTGDLIDYGRGHFGITHRDRLGDNSTYHEDRNWFLFYWLLAGGDSYTVPSYTILGNHDWRINPYPPLALAGAPSPESIINNYEEFVPEYRKWILQIAHGPGHERAFSYASTATGPLDLIEKDPASALSTIGRLALNTSRLNIKGAPTETTVASVMWYLLTINPFLDYAFPHPSGQKLLMLDWAEAEDVLFDIVEKGRARPYLPHEVERAAEGGPRAGDCLTAAQQKLVSRFLAWPGVSKVIGIHAPPVAPWSEWTDADLAASRRIFADFSTAKTWRACMDMGGRWHDSEKSCGSPSAPRGPSIVSQLPNGGKRSWNGHPLFAIKPPKAFDGMVADYGSLGRGREQFIKQLTEPQTGVRVVLSGHNHRDGLHMLWRMGPESGPETNGSLRVRLIPAPVKSVKPGSILGPIWINTSSASFRSHYHPRQGQHYYVPPGRALVSIESSGTIRSAEFRRLAGLDNRDHTALTQPNVKVAAFAIAP
jgi:hypothetical protein